MSTIAPEQTVLDAVISAMGGSDAAVYQRDGLPDVLPTAYSEVEVTRRPGGNQRSGGPGALAGLYDVQERTSGRHPIQLREHRDGTAAIEGRTLTVSGYTSTPVDFNSNDPMTPEDGWYVGFRTWTFALFPAI